MGESPPFGKNIQESPVFFYDDTLLEKKPKKSKFFLIRKFWIRRDPCPPFSPNTISNSLNDYISIIGNLSEDGRLESYFQPHQKLRQMLFQGSNLTANNQSGASRLSGALGSTHSLNDDVSIIVKTL